uniref:Uncharacterized protein n=1 Tax=Utricularia reniformis TaxID=192314 RepID=A0A1Y0AYP4_9LAMI|nr:hypothetical protein AEK19_MT0332 [Utricularia reniformis]ART30274.1 hypothetical protein AEK19_MT0332 [Utricularia reniformis]
MSIPSTKSAVKASLDSFRCNPGRLNSRFPLHTSNGLLICLNQRATELRVSLLDKWLLRKAKLQGQSSQSAKPSLRPPTILATTGLTAFSTG